MAEHDPLDDLRDVLRSGEESARPLPVERVRVLGRRRRTRRRVATATLTLALLVGGGTAITSAVLPGRRDPGPATNQSAVPLPPPTGSPSASPDGRSTVTGLTVGEDNLLAPRDVPVQGDATVREQPRSARPVDEVSVCQQQSWPELGAVAVVGRSFQRQYPDEPGTTPDPGDPLTTLPSTYAVAAQFPDVAAATRARQTYRGWVTSCPDRLAARGWTTVGGAVTWHRVALPLDRAEFTEVTYREPGHADDDAAWFESVGITQVDDRLMVTVDLVWGQDHEVAYDQQGDPDGVLPSHPQYGLCVAAAERLRR